MFDFKEVKQESYKAVDNFVDRYPANRGGALKIKGFPGMPEKGAAEERLMNQALTRAIGFVAAPDGGGPPQHKFCA
ncbi:MAG TPA: hypothetical protein VN663_12725 [Ramlibacter sp.]|nr:hypothetical protein [Ramlibacter sp.]